MKWGYSFCAKVKVFRNNSSQRQNNAFLLISLKSNAFCLKFNLMTKEKRSLFTLSLTLTAINIQSFTRHQNIKKNET